MPTAKNPDARQWYVYQFEAGVAHTPFYVGIGHHAFGVGRAEDRVRWVCSQIRRELDGKKPKLVLHARVIKALILMPEPIACIYVRKGLRRTDALRVERNQIAKLHENGFLLANIQHAKGKPPSEREILKFLRRRSK